MRSLSLGAAMAALLAACSPPAPASQGRERHEEPEEERIAPAAPVEDELEETPRAETLIIGLISSEPADAIDKYTPLARFFALAAGLPHGRVRAVTTAGMGLNELCEGRVDLLIDTVYTASLALRACTAGLLLVAAKNDTLRYESVVFVRRGSPHRTLEDLRGEVILFEDATSTSAYALPRALIEEAGVPVVAADRAVQDALSYVFVGHELNIIGGVVHGRAAAGALSSNDIEEYEGAEITEIARTAPVPRQLVIAGPHVAREGLDRVHEAALAAHTTADVASVLESARIGRFDRVSEEDAAQVAMLTRLGEAGGPR